MMECDKRLAQCETYPGAFSWILHNVEPIEPFPVRGQLGLFDVECDPKYLSSTEVLR